MGDVRSFDAPDVEAHSAPSALLGHGGGQPHLTRADGGDVSVDVGFEDDDAVWRGGLSGSHVFS